MLVIEENGRRAFLRIMEGSEFLRELSVSTVYWSADQARDVLMHLMFTLSCNFVVVIS